MQRSAAATGASSEVHASCSTRAMWTSRPDGLRLPDAHTNSTPGARRSSDEYAQKKRGTSRCPAVVLSCSLDSRLESGPRTSALRLTMRCFRLFDCKTASHRVTLPLLVRRFFRLSLDYRDLVSRIEAKYRRLRNQRRDTRRLPQSQTFLSPLCPSASPPSVGQPLLGLRFCYCLSYTRCGRPHSSTPPARADGGISSVDGAPARVPRPTCGPRRRPPRAGARRARRPWRRAG